MVDWSKIALGGAFILGGAGTGYAAKKFIPEKWKPAGYIGALGIAGIGAYQIYKAFKEEIGEQPSPELAFPIVITDPMPGEKWSIFIPYTVDVEVNNPYTTAYKVYVGMSMIYNKTGEVFDYPIKTIIINPRETKKMDWWFWGSPSGTGLYWIISSVWDLYPTGECEAQGTCHRLGISESNVEFI